MADNSRIGCKNGHTSRGNREKEEQGAENRVKLTSLVSMHDNCRGLVPKIGHIKMQGSRVLQNIINIVHCDIKLFCFLFN